MGVLQQSCGRVIQKINMSMDSMGSMGHCGLYVAQLQSPIDGPGFADVLNHLRSDASMKFKGTQPQGPMCAHVDPHPTG